MVLVSCLSRPRTLPYIPRHVRHEQESKSRSGKSLSFNQVCCCAGTRSLRSCRWRTTRTWPRARALVRQSYPS